jgi:hypothetical protein
MAQNDDRPKLSFSDLDRLRRENKFRDKSSPREDKLAKSNEYRAYKSQLNKLFDSKTSVQVTADEEALGKALDSADVSVVLEALRTLTALAKDKGLKRAASLRVRLKTVLISVDDDAVEDAAKALLELL